MPRVYALEEELDQWRHSRRVPRLARIAKSQSGLSRRVRIALAAATLTAFVAGWLLRPAPESDLLASRGRPTGLAPHLGVESVAVLPLDNVSGSPEQEYFAGGMTEALISELAKVPSLRVISRRSVMRYEGAQRPLSEIAAELGVDSIVEGSVLRAGDRVRVTAQLVEAASGQHLWAESYERPLSDLLTLQAEVARAIAEQVRAELSALEEPPPAGAGTNPEALDLYLQAIDAGDRGVAVELLEQAVAISPDFAQAHAELAKRVAGLILYENADNWLELESRAREAVDEALSLNPSLPEAYIARGLLTWTDRHSFPHKTALADFRRALTLNPSLAQAHTHAAMIGVHVGLPGQALYHLQQAEAINPGENLGQTQRLLALMALGRVEEILALARSLPPERTGSLTRAAVLWALLQLERAEEAETAFHAFQQRRPQRSGGLASVDALYLAWKGRPREAEKRIQEAAQHRDENHFHHWALTIAESYVLMKKNEDAIDWLEWAADHGYPCYPAFANDRLLAPLRQEPRFVALMERLKEQQEQYSTLL